MVQKKIGIILILIILLPVLFYTAYEINSLSGNEKLVNKIYQQQMNTLLYSVNQHAWDVSSRWADNLNFILGQPESLIQKEIGDFINVYYSIENIFIADTTMSSIHSIISTAHSNIIYNRTDVLNFLKGKQETIKILLHRKQIGYTKIESFIFSPESAREDQKILLIFISDRKKGVRFVVGMILDSEKFIQNVLVPKLNEVAQSEFVAGIFQEGNPNPVYSTEPLRSDEIKTRRNIWLFPDHYLGIKLRGVTIEDLLRGRFYRSLLFIIMLDILLIIAAYILYRNIRREMELARLKSDFVSNVSHQLRTPLALIRMFVETLELDRIRSEEERKEYYQIMAQETERLTHLMNNILDFSRMEAGKKQYCLERKDLNEIVRHTLRFYKFHLQNNGFELATDLTPASLLFQADQEAIEEALVNLLDNAMKYSVDQKYIAVKTGAENNLIYVEVEDRGIGIPENEQKRIFDKFYRIPNVMPNVKGSGLGLSLVYYIVDAHKGAIKVDSELGKGSRFRLSFPSI